MATQHPEGVIPLTFFSQIHISFKEAEFMKVDPEGVKSFRHAHSMMGSDDFVEVTAGDKRARALSASSAGGSRKSSRYE